MKNFSFRTFLLISTAIFLAGCDQNSDQSTQNSENGANDLAGFFAQNQMDTPPTTLSGSFLSGEFAQSQSDWDNAATNFGRILDAYPKSESIQRRVMALDMGAGHYDKAIETAKKIAETSKTDAGLAHLLIALSYFKESKYTEAVQELSNNQTDPLGNAILPLLKCWAEAGAGKQNIQINELKNSSTLLYQTVLIAAYAKDDTLLKALAKDNDFTKASITIPHLEQIAAVFAEHGEIEEAKSIYAALLKDVPERATQYENNLKELEAGPGLPSSKPEGQYTPQTAFSDALGDMARVLSNGYEDSARLFAHMSLYMNQNNASTLEILAQIAANNKLYNEASSYLTRIDTAHDTARKIQIIRQTAMLKVEAGQSDEAIRLLSELATDENNVDAQVQIGDIYRKDENFEDALKAYNAAYKMLGDKITAQYWDLSFARGMVNERLKNWDQAEKDLQTALTFQPDEPYVLNYLGYSWADQGLNLNKAAEMIEKAVRLKPDDGAIVDSLGWIYFRMGQFDKSVKVLEKAIELAPTEPEINDHLGDAYWRVGRKNEARFQWQRSISFSKDEAMNTKIQTKIDNGLPALDTKTPSPSKMVENK